MDSAAPDIGEIDRALRDLRSDVIETPVINWTGGEIADWIGATTRLAVKLEFLQVTGSFKARGALIAALGLGVEQLRRGVTTVSSGNHAIATAFAARRVGTSAKVVVLNTANPARLHRCRRFGAEIVVAESGAEAFELAQRLVREEGRTLMHPYEGAHVVLGTGTLALEFSQQSGELDALIVPIGGGGLCAGVANAMKQLQPNCEIYGVEPLGADVMYRSLLEGNPLASGPIATIADSLGAPFTCPQSFDLCHRYLDHLTLIDDDAIRFAMALIFRELKVVVEPSAAAATAALIGPLRHRLSGKRVGIVLCGSNIDLQTFTRHLLEAPAEPMSSRARPSLSASPGPPRRFVPEPLHTEGNHEDVK